MSLQEKIMEAFLGKVVRKDLAFLVKGGLPYLHTFSNTCWDSTVPVTTRKILKTDLKKSRM